MQYIEHTKYHYNVVPVIALYCIMSYSFYSALPEKNQVTTK